LSEEVKKFLEAHEVVYLVEQNRDAQMAAIIKEDWPELGAKIVSVLIYDGLPVTAGEIVRQIFNGAQATPREVLRQVQVKG